MNYEPTVGWWSDSLDETSWYELYYEGYYHEPDPNLIDYNDVYFAEDDDREC